jgi:hypothetical protein
MAHQPEASLVKARARLYRLRGAHVRRLVVEALSHAQHAVEEISDYE